jgi:hypothetical protein
MSGVATYGPFSAIYFLTYERCEFRARACSLSLSLFLCGGGAYISGGGGYMSGVATYDPLSSFHFFTHLRCEFVCVCVCVCVIVCVCVFSMYVYIC